MSDNLKDRSADKKTEPSSDRKRKDLREASLEVTPESATLRASGSVATVLISGKPTCLLKAVIIPGEKSAEGQLVQAVALPWFEIIKLLQKDPKFANQLDWRKWEEIIAGAYRQEGFEVTLTPRSGDGGRDVIAVKSGYGAIRFIEQVKAYRPGHVVPAEEVRALVGVLASTEMGASKGIVTTTSEFAPGVYAEFEKLIPYRLELKAGKELIDWLVIVAKKR